MKLYLKPVESTLKRCLHFLEIWEECWMTVLFDKVMIVHISDIFSELSHHILFLLSCLHLLLHFMDFIIIFIRSYYHHLRITWAIYLRSYLVFNITWVIFLLNLKGILTCEIYYLNANHSLETVPLYIKLTATECQLSLIFIYHNFFSFKLCFA